MSNVQGGQTPKTFCLLCSADEPMSFCVLSTKSDDSFVEGRDIIAPGIMII